MEKLDLGDEVADDVGVRRFDEEVEEVARRIGPPVADDEAFLR